MVLNPPDDTVITRQPLAIALALRDSVATAKAIIPVEARGGIGYGPGDAEIALGGS